ncbi:hypothetical protein [Streptomyces sp. NPDC050704]|uniref:hypothetical protein n=1 Tax=Streptomyces sp. NPDC050704 TaxID=3157219 RepID=UPI003429697D
MTTPPAVMSRMVVGGVVGVVVPGMAVTVVPGAVGPGRVGVTGGPRCIGGGVSGCCSWGRGCCLPRVG